MFTFAPFSLRVMQRKQERLLEWFVSLCQLSQIPLLEWLVWHKLISQPCDLFSLPVPCAALCLSLQILLHPSGTLALLGVRATSFATKNQTWFIRQSIFERKISSLYMAQQTVSSNIQPPSSPRRVSLGQVKVTFVQNHPGQRWFSTLCPSLNLQLTTHNSIQLNLLVFFLPSAVTATKI